MTPPADGPPLGPETGLPEHAATARVVDLEQARDERIAVSRSLIRTQEPLETTCEEPEALSADERLKAAEIMERLHSGAYGREVAEQLYAASVLADL